MTDSFFSSANAFDEQLIGNDFTAVSSEEILEAAVRRLVELEGQGSTALRLYRLADLCTGALVATEPPAWRRVTRRKRVISVVRTIAVWSFATLMVAGAGAAVVNLIVDLHNMVGG